MLHFRAIAKNNFRKTCDVILCIFGFAVMAYTTSLTVISWISGPDEVPVPGYCDKKRAGLL